MDTDLIRLLAEVVRAGSFAAAARRRKVDPSSVSRAIAALEAELGVAVLTRSTRRLALTDAGAEFLRSAGPSAEAIDAAGEAARAGREEAAGTVRLLTPVSFGQLNVVPLLPALLRAHPRLRVEVVMNDRPLDLIGHGIDLAVRIGPLADASLLARPLAAMRSHVCASPAYLAARGRPETPAELAGHDCLLLDMPGFTDRWRLRRGGVVEAIDADGPVRTSNAVALKQLALAGLGVILQGSWIVGRELADGSLVDLFPDHEATASEFDNAAYLLRPAPPQGLPTPARVRAVADHLHEAFVAGPPWARG